MTALLQQAIAVIEKLPAPQQDAIARRLLAELADDAIWDERFQATTDDQWDQLAARVRRDIAAGETVPLVLQLYFAEYGFWKPRTPWGSSPRLAARRPPPRTR
jgi:hypothetical protein